MRFENPHNGYVEEASGPFSWLWCFLFNWLYFAVKGNWRHAFLYCACTMFTLGLAIFIYPWFVYRINDNHYRRMGWKDPRVLDREHKQQWDKVVAERNEKYDLNKAGI
jgi:hypothetical protein